MPTAIALVSFTVRPGAGSEAGVGWAFLEALLARAEGPTVHLLLDQRDEDAVREGLAALPAGGRVVVHPVRVPEPVLRVSGDRRTRESYLAWVGRARSRLRAIAEQDPLAVAHQVTFASAVLPPVLAAGVADRVVWGPLSVPASATGGAGRVRLLGRAAVRVAEAAAARNLGAADLVVTNNEHSARFVQQRGHRVVVEPNIFVDRRPPAAGPVDDHRLLLVGHLVERKRPWLAIEALADPRLDGLRLDVLGDGPLRAPMEALAARLGVAPRVRFTGALPRDETLALMSTSRLLVHPSAREGSPWVVGEAAASGLASVVMPGSGAEATVRLSDNGGIVAPEGEPVASLVAGVQEALRSPRPEPSDRWSPSRLPGLLERWYGVER